MPLYQYECDECGYAEEVLQSIKEMETGVGTPSECDCSGHFVRIMGKASIGICDTNMLRDAYKSRFDFDDQTDFRGDLYAKKAKAAGVDTTGRWYLPSLAIEVGDPFAWVGSINEIKEKCQMRGWAFSITDGEIKIGIPADISKPIAQQTVKS